jgi:hypothetical protein
VFVVSDSLASIAEATEWAIQVSGYQGAPSLVLSNIRPRGSKIASGGDSSGAASFGMIFDGVIGSMRRPTKKNGAGIMWLDWNHGDLQEFLEADYRFAFRGVYIPNDDDIDGMKKFKNSPQYDLITKAFNENKCFVCKLPDTDLYTREPLYLNLCTEVEIPHRGFCILGVINLAQFDLSSLDNLSEEFVEATLEMERDMGEVLKGAQSTPLYCSSPANRQFGLGVSGLASLLANCNVTYADFTKALCDVVGVDFSIDGIYGRASRAKVKSDAYAVVYAIVRSYYFATNALNNRVSRAFCVQPSATGAYACADVAGYHSSPELQPVIGIRDERGVHTIRKSAMLGDEKIVFHYAVETIDDVPYSVYADLCEAYQRLLYSTGLGHRHSACFYGDSFTTSDMDKFVSSSQQNLYYRLQPYNPNALNKTDVGDGVETDVDLDALLGGACNLQTKGNVDCDCTM